MPSEDQGGQTGGAPSSEIDDEEGTANGPLLHPPVGFESCSHPEVAANCDAGWCEVPSGCFVIGSPETEWRRGKDDETQTAVQLSKSKSVQQFEFSRGDWRTVFVTEPPATDDCFQDDCPLTRMSFWDALSIANSLSAKQGFEQCYSLSECMGKVGVDLSCSGVSEPKASVYECTGFRLMTAAEAEFVLRAGTISEFYSGSIKKVNSPTCWNDPTLDEIAWYCDNCSASVQAQGRLKPNAFGLYDLSGNASEWLNQEQEYLSSPGGTDPVGWVGEGERRIVLQGCVASPSQLRAAAKLSLPQDARIESSGFRLIRTL